MNQGSRELARCAAGTLGASFDAGDWTGEDQWRQGGVLPQLRRDAEEEHVGSRDEVPERRSLPAFDVQSGAEVWWSSRSLKTM